MFYLSDNHILNFLKFTNLHLYIPNFTKKVKHSITEKKKKRPVTIIREWIKKVFKKIMQMELNHSC